MTNLPHGSDSTPGPPYTSCSPLTEHDVSRVARMWRRWWIKIVAIGVQNYATVDRDGTIFFVDEERGIFDKIACFDLAEAEEALRVNFFEPYSIEEFRWLGTPDSSRSQFRLIEGHQVYSSGAYWVWPDDAFVSAAKVVVRLSPEVAEDNLIYDRLSRFARRDLKILGRTQRRNYRRRGVVTWDFQLLKDSVVFFEYARACLSDDRVGYSTT